MKTLVLLCVGAFACFGQGTPVNQVQAPPASPYVMQGFYDASGNFQYRCRAPQFLQLASTVKISDTSLTSIVVSTNVGTVTTANPHGAWIGMTVVVTGSTTAALNATYKVATVPSTTTYTIATSGVADATYNNAAMVISTNNPLLTAAVWAIEVNTYNGSNQWTGSYWANSSTGHGLACSNRATY